MAKRLERMFGERRVLCDGALGTEFYERGVRMGECCEALNLCRGELVRSVHEAYVRAGAEMIETNTFGGNAFRLAGAGLRERVAEMNRAGVRIAREAVRRAGGQEARRVWVAGSVGPLGVRLEVEGGTSRREARAAFAEQMAALAEGGPGVGVDLLIVETVMALNEAEEAVLAAREVAPDLPVMVLVTVDAEGNCLDGSSAEEAARRIAVWGADAAGVNCSVGPASVLRAVRRMAAATKLPLAAMPSAGLPETAGGKMVYPSGPEAMAGFAREIARAGAQLIGGCCGTTPAHIAAMKSVLGEKDYEGGGG